MWATIILSDQSEALRILSLTVATKADGTRVSGVEVEKDAPEHCSPPNAPLPGHKICVPSENFRQVFNGDTVLAVKLLIEAETEAEDYPRHLLDIMTVLRGSLEEELMKEVVRCDPEEGRPLVVNMLRLLGLMIEDVQIAGGLYPQVRIAVFGLKPAESHAPLLSERSTLEAHHGEY